MPMTTLAAPSQVAMETCSSAEDITTGDYNTIIGQQAMQNAQSGVHTNVAVGWRAGYKLGDDGGSNHSSNNVLLGVAAGGGGSSTAANNTANTARSG